MKSVCVCVLCVCREVDSPFTCGSTNPRHCPLSPRKAAACGSGSSGLHEKSRQIRETRGGDRVSLQAPRIKNPVAVGYLGLLANFWVHELDLLSFNVGTHFSKPGVGTPCNSGHALYQNCLERLENQALQKICWFSGVVMG